MVVSTLKCTIRRRIQTTDNKEPNVEGKVVKIYIYNHQNSNVFTGREKGHMKSFSKRFLTFLKCKDAWGIKNKSDKNIGQFPTSLGSPAMM